MKISKCFIIALLVFCQLTNNYINCTKSQTATSTIASFTSNYKAMKKGKVSSGNEKTEVEALTGVNLSAKKEDQGPNITFQGNVPSQEYNANLAQVMNIPSDADGEPKVNMQDVIQDLKSKDLPDRQVYFQGWVKYFRYLESGEAKPSTFFKNQQFQQQDEETAKKGGSDDSGPLFIPSEKHFFSVIYGDRMNILNARENPLNQVVDSLSIPFIKTIPEDNNFAGGIKDFGKFSEGSCYEVKSVKPNGTFKMTQDHTEPENGAQESWLVCYEDDAKKREAMNLLINLKLKMQHQVGAYSHTSNDSMFKNKNQIKQAEETMGGLLTGAGQINDPNAKREDGYWVVINDWTPCTLKCGGGLMYLQLMCMPPKNGGKACQGESVRTKPCNEQPCPKVDALQKVFQHPAMKKGQDKIVEKPVVKMMPISSRPQRYDKCMIKDSDALMLKNDKETADMENPPRIPIRLVMNNKSISVYQDETLTTNLFTFMLSQTTFGRVKDDSRCFILVGSKDKVQFCQLDSSSGQNFVEEWDYDFNLFKFQCKQPREKVDFAEDEVEFKKKMGQIQADLNMQKAQKIKAKEERVEETKMQKQVEDTQKVTLMAVEKELRMEDLLEKEEMAREKDETRKLKEMIDAERNRDECLQKNIREKEVEDQYNLAKQEAQEEMNKIKEDAKRQIILKRNNVKNKLAGLKRQHEREKQQLMGQLMALRSQTTTKMQKYTKDGSSANCWNQEKDPNSEKMEEYCQVHYHDNSSKYSECRQEANFCYVCCETEFGEMKMQAREQCYKDKCDQVKTVKSANIINALLDPDKDKRKETLTTNV
jgi:hypothetical protein